MRNSGIVCRRNCEVDTADQLVTASENFFEDWLRVFDGVVNHLKHLRCGRLVFQRFLDLGGTRLYFLELLDVLNGDHRLCRKTPDKFYFVFGVGFGLFAKQDQHTDAAVRPQQGYKQVRANAVVFDHGFKNGRTGAIVFGLRYVFHMHRLPGQDRFGPDGDIRVHWHLS